MSVVVVGDSEGECVVAVVDGVERVLAVVVDDE